MIHADVSADLLRTIFAPQTPLHDGAVIIREETILAAGALLPLAETTVHTRAVRDAPPGRPRHHRADRRGRHRRLRGERPGQPRRAGADRAQPQRAAARPGDPVAARADRGPRAVRRPGHVADKKPGGRAPRLAELTRFVGRGRSARRSATATGRRAAGGTRPGPAVSRILGLLFHNWPLKLAAIVLATMLYGGFVISQSVQEFPGSVLVAPDQRPTDAFYGTNLPQVTSIRYIAVGNASARASADSFQATIDLADVDPEAGPTYVPIKVAVRRSALHRRQLGAAGSQRGARSVEGPDRHPGPCRPRNHAGGSRRAAGRRVTRRPSRSGGPPRSSTGSSRSRRTS